MQDQDDVNTLIAEDKAQRKEERELKTKILNIYNPTRRMEEWKKHFKVQVESSDDYLMGKIF
jgi:hypothetical protein